MKVTLLLGEGNWGILNIELVKVDSVLMWVLNTLRWMAGVMMADEVVY